MLSDPWFIGSIVVAIAGLMTGIHILIALFRKVGLNPGGPGFGSAVGFSNDAKQRLEDHYGRIRGTLIFWKNQAALYGRIFRYTVFWSTLSGGLLIPILIQVYDSRDLWARAFLSVLSGWTAFLVVINRAFKAEELYRGFRQCESEFYDTMRRLLDRPDVFGTTEEERLNNYFEMVEKIRKIGRDSETNNFPSATLT